MKQIEIRLEDLRKEYPPMPAEIRHLIQREVAFQTKVVPLKFSWKKAVLLALATTMALGATAIAGGALSRLRVQKEGEYALHVGVTPAADASSVDAPSAIPAQIPRLSLRAGYIPEGYCPGEAAEGWNLYPEEASCQNGITAGIFALGEEITEQGFPLTISYVLYSEEISWQDRTALYVELQQPDWDAPRKRIYIPLPEYWQGLTVYAWENTSKEEMIKYAENLEVLREEGTCDSAGMLGWVERPAEREASLDYGAWEAPAERVLKNMHPVGETFPLRNTVQRVSEGAELAACVKKVEVFDDFSPLDARYLNDTSLALLDESRKLKPNLIRYMSQGDGIKELSSEISAQTVAQKLVYVTVEYTNISSRNLQNITDCASLCRMIERDGSFVVYERAREDGDSKTDYIIENKELCHGRMIYSDACPSITELKAGETATIHIAGVVNADELDKLYLNFGGSEDVISEWTLAGGYVDLRR